MIDEISFTDVNSDFTFKQNKTKYFKLNYSSYIFYGTQKIPLGVVFLKTFSAAIK